MKLSSIVKIPIKIEIEQSEFPNEGGTGIIAVVDFFKAGTGSSTIHSGHNFSVPDYGILRGLLAPSLESLRKKGIIARTRRHPHKGLAFKLESYPALAAEISNAKPVTLPTKNENAATIQGAPNIDSLTLFVPTLDSYNRVSLQTYQCIFNMNKIESSMKHLVEMPSRELDGSNETKNLPFLQGIPSLNEFSSRYCKFKEKYKSFSDKLLPFQHEGLKFGLLRGGRVLIADEMGVGKTLQAIALSLCYREEWPLLVIVPASLRIQWAEEIEIWVRDIRSSDIKVIMSSSDRLGTSTICGGNQNVRNCLPLVTIISYHMLVLLREEIRLADYKVVIIDESHQLRGHSSQQKVVSENVTMHAKRIVMLSGTPCVTKPLDLYHQINMLRPGLLGFSISEFGKRYCNNEERQRGIGQTGFYTGARRVNELKLLLTKTVMIRRLKAEIGENLPPLRRQIVQLDVADAQKIKKSIAYPMEWRVKIAQLKINPVIEWLREQINSNPNVKFIIFGHHREMLNSVQCDVLEKTNTQYIRIDGTTPSSERFEMIKKYKENQSIKVALLSIRAACVGFDLSNVSVMVFTELPSDVSSLRQAEDRTHRRGQTKSVNAYYLCARHSIEQREWQRLSTSLDVITTIQDSGNCAKTRSLEPDVVLNAEDGLENRIDDQALHSSVISRKEDLHFQTDTSYLREIEFKSTHDCLWFEVSKHTGRLHLHGADDGSTPLGISFMPENVVDPSEDEKGSSVLPLPSLLAEDPLCLRLVKDFISEWQFLTGQVRGMLYGQILRPPLKDSVDRVRIAKLRKGDSCDLLTSNNTERRMNTSHINPNLCVNADVTLRKVSYKIPYSDATCDTIQAFMSEVLRLCLHCEKSYTLLDVDGRVQSPDTILIARYQLYCSGHCHEEHLMRTRSGHLRYAISKLEKGICHGCGINCINLVQRLKAARCSDDDNQRHSIIRKRIEIVKKLAPRFMTEGNENRLARLVQYPCEGHAWEADHTVPVYAGGGRCGLENVHILCSVCHGLKSSREARERATKRRRRSARP